MGEAGETIVGRTTRRRLLASGLGAAGAWALGDDLRVVATAQSIQRGGTLRVGVDGDPPSMDPHRSAAYVDRQVYQSLYDKLVDTDENLRIVPMLATSWTISADGKTATFKLRQGVKFHDGTPFNANAALYNFTRMLFDPKFPSFRKSELRPVTKAVVVDDYTIQLIMDQPYGPLLYALTDRAGMMVSPAAASQAGIDYGLHPVGTGPFYYAQRAVGDTILLRRNPVYWQPGKPYLDAVLFKVFTDDNARVANLKSGDIDIVSLVPLPQVKTLTQQAASPNATFRLIDRSPIAWSQLALNVTIAPFNNLALRQAFLATIDQKALAGTVMQGAAYPAYGFFPNGTPAYNPAWTLPARNVGTAKSKLSEGGAAGGFSFTIVTPNGQTLLSALQAIQSMASEAGIQMKIEVVEGASLVQRLTHLQLQAAWVDWSGRPDPDFDVYPFVTQSGIGVLNYSGYTNPKVQALLDSARAEYDMGKRRALYAQITTMLAADVPYIPLYFPREFKLVSRKLQGFVDQPDGMMRFHGAWLAG
jgi:peptide/nickel transport system substrate-binding protein